jgi:iron-sulfur cluster repair protein YtfE (RIC family)
MNYVQESKIIWDNLIENNIEIKYLKEYCLTYFPEITWDNLTNEQKENIQKMMDTHESPPGWSCKMFKFERKNILYIFESEHDNKTREELPIYSILTRNYEFLHIDHDNYVKFIEEFVEELKEMIPNFRIR